MPRSDWSDFAVPDSARSCAATMERPLMTSSRFAVSFAKSPSGTPSVTTAARNSSAFATSSCEISMDTRPRVAATHAGRCVRLRTHDGRTHEKVCTGENNTYTQLHIPPYLHLRLSIWSGNVQLNGLYEGCTPR